MPNIDSVLFWEQMSAYFVDIALNILSFVLVMIVGYIISKLVTKIVKKVFLKGNVDAAATGFVCSVIKVAIMVITIIVALSELGVNLNSAVTALGAAGLTASFALQGSLSNFVSGIQIIFSKPFKTDDFLEINGFCGTVKNITVLNTTLLTPDNKELVVPNSKLTTDIVTNYTSQTARRLDLSYGIDYSTDIDFAKEIVKKEIEKCSYVLKNPSYNVAVGKHQDSSVEIIGQVWIEPANYWSAYFHMQEAVKKAFDENKIVIPFPQVDVHSK